MQPMPRIFSKWQGEPELEYCPKCMPVNWCTISDVEKRRKTEDIGDPPRSSQWKEEKEKPQR